MSDIPMPSRKWLTRVALPGVLIGSAAGLLVYSARESLTPAADVVVTPVFTRAVATRSVQAGVVAQAPGWVEASPYPIRVTALTDGVVKESLVLEGERVEPGQVVARLIDDDARLDIAQAEAMVAEARAMVSLAEAEERVARSRLEEVRDELARKEPLVKTGGFTEAEVARLRYRLVTMETEADAARARVASVGARVASAVVEQSRARLRLDRTSVRAATGGVVLSGIVEPGSILMDDRVVLRLYDPSRLQVRADVPLSDATKVHEGMEAEVRSEADPSKVWRGRVTRGVHEADLQRNTVQYKVEIEDASGRLRPEMLVRVRFLGSEGPEGVGGAGSAGAGVVVVSGGAVRERNGDRASVLVVEVTSRSGARAVRREVTLGADAGEGLVEVVSGLRAGDRVIVGGVASEGRRVRITGEDLDERGGA